MGLSLLALLGRRDGGGDSQSRLSQHKEQVYQRSSRSNDAWIGRSHSLDRDSPKGRRHAMSLLTFGRNKKNIFLFVCSNEQYAANDSPYFKFLVVVSLTCRNCVHWWQNFNHFVSLQGSAPFPFSGRKLQLCTHGIHAKMCFMTPPQKYEAPPPARVPLRYCRR